MKQLIPNTVPYLFIRLLVTNDYTQINGITLQIYSLVEAFDLHIQQDVQTLQQLFFEAVDGFQHLLNYHYYRE